MHKTKVDQSPSNISPMKIIALKIFLLTANHLHNRIAEEANHSGSFVRKPPIIKIVLIENKEA